MNRTTRPQFKERIRRDMLKGRNLERTGKGHIEEVPAPPPDPRKTLKMWLLEQRFQRSIQELLVLGTLEEVGMLLEIDQSTVSRWRLKLGLR